MGKDDKKKTLVIGDVVDGEVTPAVPVAPKEPVVKPAAPCDKPAHDPA
jgi:hypothetical protein